MISKEMNKNLSINGGIREAFNEARRQKALYGDENVYDLSLAVNIEFVAEMQYRTMCIGQPVILTDEQMHASMERSKTYGQK